MARLGYLQECRILRMSADKTCNDHGKVVNCRYLELDISARNAMTEQRLNIRYLVVRVINKKIIAQLQNLSLPCSVRLRLYASGYRDRSRANRCACAIDVYELEEI